MLGWKKKWRNYNLNSNYLVGGLTFWFKCIIIRFKQSNSLWVQDEKLFYIGGVVLSKCLPVTSVSLRFYSHLSPREVHIAYVKPLFCVLLVSRGNGKKTTHKTVTAPTSRFKGWFLILSLSLSIYILLNLELSFFSIFL